MSKMLPAEVEIYLRNAYYLLPVRGGEELEAIKCFIEVARLSVMRYNNERRKDDDH